MPDELPMDRPSWKHRFPALRLIEATEIALSPASVAIATIASVLLTLAGWLADHAIPHGSASQKSNPAKRSMVMGDDSNNGSFDTAKLLRPWFSVIQPAISVLRLPMENSAAPNQVTSAYQLRLNRILHDDLATNTVPDMGREKITVQDPGVTGASQLNSLLRFAIVLGIWSCFGAILCRRSALLFVGDDENTVQRSIRYSLRRWRFSMGAPLIPLAATVPIGLLFFLAGLLGRLPGLGGIWLTIISPLMAIMGLVAVFLFLITAIGWPLMLAAIATDDCDSFGGLSRAYSGLTGRSWYALFLGFVGLVLGVVLMSIVNIVADATIWCVISGVGQGAGGELTRKSLLGPLTWIVGEAANGVGINCFWSLSTIIYLLLRHEIDAVPLDRLAIDDEARPVRDPFPVVGIPATDARNESSVNVEKIE